MKKNYYEQVLIIRKIFWNWYHVENRFLQHLFIRFSYQNHLNRYISNDFPNLVIISKLMCCRTQEDHNQKDL